MAGVVSRQARSRSRRRARAARGARTALRREVGSDEVMVEYGGGVWSCSVVRSLK